MKHLEDVVEDASISGWLYSVQSLQIKVRKIFETTRKGVALSYASTQIAI